MREAQQMMADPAFQERMKSVTDNPQFKESMNKTQEMMKDKDKVKELEDSMKKRVEEGTKELEEFKKKSAELEEAEKVAAGELKVSLHNYIDVFGNDFYLQQCEYLHIFPAAKEEESEEED
jgi:hypothetical protein